MEFSFNDIMYAQIDDVSIGSPLGPVLANIFMKSFLLKNATSPIFIIVMLVIYFLSSIPVAKVFQLNSLHLSLQFTMEEKCDLSLLFLDGLLIGKMVLSSLVFIVNLHLLDYTSIGIICFQILEVKFNFYFGTSCIDMFL